MTNILTVGDIETPRSPTALSEWYYTKHAEIGHDKIEVEKARCAEGLYRYFVREIYPLVVFAKWKFPHDDVLCIPKIGNQGYDALLRPTDDPKYEISIEVAWPQDGMYHKEVAKALNDHGFHEWTGDEFDRYNADVLRGVIVAARKRKSLNDYRSVAGSALLIVVDTFCSPPGSQRATRRDRETLRRHPPNPFSSGFSVSRCHTT